MFCTALLPQHVTDSFLVITINAAHLGGGGKKVGALLQQLISFPSYISSCGGRASALCSVWYHRVRM